MCVFVCFIFGLYGALNIRRRRNINTKKNFVPNGFQTDDLSCENTKLYTCSNENDMKDM